MYKTVVQDTPPPPYMYHHHSQPLYLSQNGNLFQGDFEFHEYNDLLAIQILHCKHF